MSRSRARSLRTGSEDAVLAGDERLVQRAVGAAQSNHLGAARIGWHVRTRGEMLVDAAVGVEVEIWSALAIGHRHHPIPELPGPLRDGRVAGAQSDLVPSIRPGAFRQPLVPGS
jgi:hypothetical protein